MNNHTARDFALQLGALVSLYLSLSFLLVLLFGIINISFPDPAEGYWTVDSAQGSIKMGIAVLLVFFPTYIVLTRTVNQIRRLSSDGTYLGLTKWLIYLSLLVGGGVLLGDLVTVIVTYLEGEVTTRFLLKALAVLLVVGTACKYYLLDARGYWMQHEATSVAYGLGAFAVVLVSVAYGLVLVDSPTEAREQRLDETTLRDLQDIQFHIQDHLQTTGELPQTLADAYVTEVPTAPGEREPYAYSLTEDGFALCATFAHPSERQEFSRAVPIAPDSERVFLSQNWEHPAGRYCFERNITTATTAPEAAE